MDVDVVTVVVVSTLVVEKVERGCVSEAAEELTADELLGVVEGVMHDGGVKVDVWDKVTDGGKVDEVVGVEVDDTGILVALRWTPTRS